jgi:hypothetical protein
MPNEQTWVVVTWLRADFGAPIRHNTIAQKRERNDFDSQKEAVGYAMSLEDKVRRSVEIEMPGRGAPLGLPIIKQMYETQKLADEAEGLG